ncbi:MULTISPECIES: hypothetical protein [Methylococcus]|nr:hypothetical protein [Methylococcus capsulatus]
MNHHLSAFLHIGKRRSGINEKYGPAVRASTPKALRDAPQRSRRWPAAIAQAPRAWLPTKAATAAAPLPASTATRMDPAISTPVAIVSMLPVVPDPVMAALDLHIALLDETNGKVLVVTDEISNQVIQTGNLITVPTWAFGMNQPA